MPSDFFLASKYAIKDGRSLAGRGAAAGPLSRTCDPCTKHILCSAKLYVRGCVTCPYSQRETGGGINATSDREISASEYKEVKIYPTSHVCTNRPERRVFMVHRSSGWQIYTRACHNPHLSWTANLLYGRDGGTQPADTHCTKQGICSYLNDFNSNNVLAGSALCC